MEKTNKQFIINSNNSLHFLLDKIIDYLSFKLPQILKFFGLKEFRQVTINLFDDREDYLEFSRKFFEPTSYSIGNFTNGMINYYCDLDKLKIERQIKYLCTNITHELIHIIYEELIQEKTQDARIKWLDEGLANYLSGENDNSDINQFKWWFLDRIVRRDKIIPLIEMLKFNDTFVGEQNEFNGDDLSYLLVRYLIETRTDEKFQTLIRSKKMLLEIEPNILDEAIGYYVSKFPVKENFNEINTLEELFDYMCKYMLYGWFNNKNEIKLNTMEDFKNEYIVSSNKKVLECLVGTCIEQVAFQKYWFDLKGIYNELYVIRRPPKAKGELGIHCFSIVYYNDKWYYFEHANAPRRGIYIFDTKDEAIDYVLSYYKNEEGSLTEVNGFPCDLSFKEFNSYIDQIESISIEHFKLGK